MLELLVILNCSSLHVEFPWYIWGLAVIELIWKLNERSAKQVTNTDSDKI